MRYAAKTFRLHSTMRKAVLFLVGFSFLCFIYSVEVVDAFKDPTRTYKCKFRICEKMGRKSNVSVQNFSLQTCNMLCGDLPLWPKPRSTKLSKRNMTSFIKNEIALVLKAPNAMENYVREAYDIFMTNLPGTYDPLLNSEEKVNIIINLSSDHRVLTLTSDESYHLTVLKLNEEIKIHIRAITYFGVRHGLETLSQLIWYDEITHKLNIVHDVEIGDKPKFPYRGLMVDTARNYFRVELLKKVLDGMAASKLNVFHLHLTDASSFPIVLPRNKLFARYGAYSEEMVYTKKDIKGLVEYARIRGIRVILEIDAPSHMSQDLNKAKKDLVICGDEARFNGHLNPKNTETLHVLEDIYKDLLDLGTDSEIFHVGGDEVNLTCWDSLVPKPTPQPPKSTEQEDEYFLASQNYLIESMMLWINFTNQMFDTLKSANKQKLPKHVVIWSSDLTNDYLKSLSYKDNIVVQYWFGSIYPILGNGHKVILSTVGNWYLDCGYGSWSTNQDIGVCDPYTTWHTFYKYRPWVDQFPEYKEQILGGEACLWTEMVNADTLETRIWPRTAAFAERMWSDPEVYERGDVFKRLDIHRDRLRERGIKSEAIWPLWCSQNPSKC